MTKPLFSIVMPTRNRPHLLQYSLQTALEQRFDDFEVLVSDNSSDRATRDLVAGFESPHLRYVKTDRDLSMPDSWEFAITQAQGRYITYLCDDDAVSPMLLSTVARVLWEDTDVQLIVWGHAQYVHENWFEPHLRNTLHIPAHTGQVHQVSSHDRLHDLYALCLWECPKPLMLNSMCSRTVVDAIRSDAGLVFVPPAPDYSFAASALATTDSFTHLDRPLMITGAAKESIGMSHFYGDEQAIGTFVEEFRGRELLPDVPFPLLTGTNIISQTLVNATKSNPRLARLALTLDMAEYFLAHHRELRVWELNGVDIRESYKRFRRLLEQQDPETRATVKRRLRGQRPRRFVRRTIRRSTTLARFEKLLRPPSAHDSSRRFDGGSLGFANILECARRFEDLIDSGEVSVLDAHSPGSP